jgi:antitoxin component YwqK of YwqJK toxin-antitoxin module
MKISLLFFTIIFGIAQGSKAQRVITILPNGEVKSFSKEELKQNKDRSTDGYRVQYSDSGVVIEEVYMKDGYIDGSRKKYNNGILVALGSYAQGNPVGTHYFWDEKGILTRSVTYLCGKVERSKDY